MLRRLGRAAGALAVVAMTAAGAPAPAAAEGICQRLTHAGNGYVVCTVPAAQEPNLQLWLKGADGQVLGQFDRISATLPQGRALAFAMNAGMYHEDRSPVGLMAVDGTEISPLVTAGGGGNFGMLPNGVFCTGGKRPFQVIESRAFAKAKPDCRLATQSGPMLLLDGQLHPRFLADSTSRYVRNGVGVDDKGQVAWFAISDRPVTFYEFAMMFRDGLGARDALYFDGSISRLHAPGLGRSDRGRLMGPVIGLVGDTAQGS
ncbi:phosphodiester glycosidase family protein [Paracoccus pacificus]|uniref:Phosphodiester glycosidase family protein n=1 Tax=Paracoccus pacificus TaxID=1463598 RepID=A0ABW4RCI9_9RHOB